MESEKKKQGSWGIWLVLGILLVLGLGVLICEMIEESTPKSYVSSNPSRTYNTGGMSEYERKKTFYDMIAVQDQYPYDNAWNQGVKEAAANHYNVPMDVINDIIHQGATEGWLQPDPP